jgi:conjugative relaxase-like TrwC/TraI family protein
MVSVGKLKAAQARYYLDQVESHPSPAHAVASGAEDYYLGGTEAAGEWHGRGAASLGLRGTVEAEQLERTLAGQAPLTGVCLRRSGSVAGFDVTFSAPKSASVLFGIGDAAMQTTIREAHKRAVAEAFRYFEDAVSIARRGAGGRRRIGARGVTGAAFLHRTSRAGDPQLHTHVIVANLIQGSDGQWTALDGRLVYAHARTAGYLYQAALRAELARSLGVRWRPVRNGMAEIDGVPEKTLRAFSRRRVEIEEAMARHGSAGAEAARVAALDTRHAKDRNVRPEQLVPAWRDRAVGHGLHEWRIEHICRYGRTVEQPDWGELFGHLAGPDGLTRDQSAFGRRDVILALSAAAGDGAPVQVIRAAAAAFLESPRVIRLLGSRARDVEPQYSTPELLAIETRILDDAARLQHAGRGVVVRGFTDSAIDRRPFLADEQRTMVRRLTQDGDGVAIVIGLAGTGKTTALAAAREAWEQSGVPVRGCALARRAAHELEQKAGLRATSVAGLLRRPCTLPAGTVLVVDEAGMLGTRDLEKLLNLVGDARGKPVLAGDASQLPSIQAGGALQALSARLDPIVLRENRRQRLAWEREAVEALRVGDQSALECYADKGRLVVGRDDEEVLPKLVADWRAYDDPDGAVMIAHRRTDVAELNARARAVMRATGQLGADELVAGGAALAASDRVLVKRNDSRCDVRNGDRGVIERVDQGEGSLHVRVDDRTVVLDSRFLAQPTQTGRPALEHGYAITAYAAQGMTCRHALVLARDDAYREWIYTTMTRASEANRLYVVGERQRGRDREEFAQAEPTSDGRVLLAAALTRSNADELALDRLLPPREVERSAGRSL